MVIANLDGQVEKIFRLNVGREETKHARNDSRPDSNALTTDSPSLTSQPPTQTIITDGREESHSTRTVNHKETTTADLDDAGLPIWLL